MSAPVSPFILSPYDLTDQSPAAVAALLLADECSASPGVVTLAPLATEDGPLPAELVEAWWWTGPLWSEGIVGTIGIGGQTNELLDRALGMLDGCSKGIDVRGLVDASLGLGADRKMTGFARDIVRGGVAGLPRLIVDAALEVVAADAGGPLIRSDAGRRPGERRVVGSGNRVAVSIPLLIGADGGLILALRRELGAVLGPVRRGMRDLIAATGDGRACPAIHRDVVLPATREYAAAFEQALPAFLDEADQQGLMVRAAEVVLGVQRGVVGSALSNALGRLRQLGGDARDEPGVGVPARPAVWISVRRSPWDVRCSEPRNATA